MKMTDKELYQIWAPTGKKWVDWVRPVPFIGVTEAEDKENYEELIIGDTVLHTESYPDAAVIVDLHGMESVAMGLSLAKNGFRPIPAYNGTIEQSGARATVDNRVAGIGLLKGAEFLSSLTFKEDASPAFLIDRNRLNRYKPEIGFFDNSWDIYSQDLPTGDYLYGNGIRKVIVVGKPVTTDLKKILFAYQKKNLEIYVTDGYEEPRKIKVRKPFMPERY